MKLEIQIPTELNEIKLVQYQKFLSIAKFSFVNLASQRFIHWSARSITKSI